jgi:hypothetical protein
MEAKQVEILERKVQQSHTRALLQSRRDIALTQEAAALQQKALASHVQASEVSLEVTQQVLKLQAHGVWQLWALVSAQVLMLLLTAILIVWLARNSLQSDMVSSLYYNLTNSEEVVTTQTLVYVIPPAVEVASNAVDDKSSIKSASQEILTAFGAFGVLTSLSSLWKNVRTYLFSEAESTPILHDLPRLVPSVVDSSVAPEPAVLPQTPSEPLFACVSVDSPSSTNLLGYTVPGLLFNLLRKRERH